jgi:hypothetical protein
LEFHYTPKHASWLNMVEIEIGVLVSQCLDRRIPDKVTLVSEVVTWERRRNAERARINWDVHHRPRPPEAAPRLPFACRPAGPGRCLNRSSSLWKGTS